MICTINDIADIQIGYQAKGRLKESPDSRYRILQLKDIDIDVALPDWSRLMQIDPERKPERYSVSEGDILFACRGPRNYALHIKQIPEWVLATNAFYILRPEREVILPEYLAWWLSLDNNRNKIETIRTQGVMPLVPKADLAKFAIHVPDMEAQANIVLAWALATKERCLMTELAEKKLQLAQLLCKQSAANIITGKIRKEPARGPLPMLVYQFEYEEMPVENLDNDGNLYSFRLSGIATEIRIWLYKREQNGAVWFAQSHWIKTPKQIGPYRTSRPFNDNEPRALRQAIRGLIQFYEEAVSAGHEPDESWLIENKNFTTEAGVN
jgi:hypothetical protein